MTYQHNAINPERIERVLHGVNGLGQYNIDVDSKVWNIEWWLQQSSYDASILTHMLQSYEEYLRSKLEVPSRKLGLAHLHSRLVSEWMDSSAAPISGGLAPDEDESLEVVDLQKERLQELCDKFEQVVFTPLETDQVRIEKYLQGLFSGDDGEKSLKFLRTSVQANERVLLRNTEPFNKDTLGWCINGLLAEDLLSDEKQAILREFLTSPAILNEIADVLNMRFTDFDNWSWEAGAGGIPVLPRPQLNGKYRIWMDEDVLQAIFIHYVGIKNCVDLKSILNMLVKLEDGPWKWSSNQSWNNLSAERFRYEFFSGEATVPTKTVENTRSNDYRESFFLSQLPESVRTIGQNHAYVNDGDPGEGEKNGEKQDQSKEPKNVNVKQELLRSLATEAIVRRTLDGEAAVLQSDLKWYATGLSHTTIFAVMRFVGYSERLISFYQKMLQAPLNMVSTPGAVPTGEPRIRQREKLIGELILFMMDLSVNKTAGMFLYRLHDDLFLCGQPARCAQAWSTMEEFADVMGVEFNASKTGSVYLTNPDMPRDEQVSAILPKGTVRIGHLILDQETGEWVLDKDQIKKHMLQLKRQLAACTSILDWVKTWDSCIGRFFSHTLGEPANCFGRKHVDSVLQTHRTIQQTLFGQGGNSEVGHIPEGNVVHYLKSKIRERFGVTDIPDAFIYLPEKLGGLNDEKAEYDRILKDFRKETKSRIGDLNRLRRIYADNEHYESARKMLDDFFPIDEISFEEYTRHREVNSNLLNKVYQELMAVPSQEWLTINSHVRRVLSDLGYELDEGPGLQVAWVLQMYEEELKERWGGFKLVDGRYIPLGVFTMMRSKGVQWNMVFPRELLTSLLSQISSIPQNTSTSTSNDVRSSTLSSHQPSTTSNPLRAIPPAYRPLLTTLHVLYPTTLLPALDLLDRRLVTRVILKEQEQVKEDEETDVERDEEKNNKQPIYHLVRSAQTPSKRRHHAPSGPMYVVRLTSWNCTCAAFAFAAFPPLSSSPSSPSFFSSSDPLPAGDAKWEFGGRSTDGVNDGGGVPCCKHLLACVLAERWEAVLGGYMEQRVVGREEGAGLVADL
ncbi:hypothetical protein GGS20DRAFT_580345 [Poronia punctata]|nr:hypothetical protein GGS20DRAFT_580345 [Poronia punctata]